MSGKQIATRTVVVTTWATRRTFISSPTLLASLYVIRDAAVEEHTRDNIQVLIDQITNCHPTA